MYFYFSEFDDATKLEFNFESTNMYWAEWSRWLGYRGVNWEFTLRALKMPQFLLVCVCVCARVREKTGNLKHQQDPFQL